MNQGAGRETGNVVGSTGASCHDNSQVPPKSQMESGPSVGPARAVGLGTGTSELSAWVLAGLGLFLIFVLRLAKRSA